MTRNCIVLFIVLVAFAALGSGSPVLLLIPLEGGTMASLDLGGGYGVETGSDATLAYNDNNRISKIGHIEIEYNSEARIEKIGALVVSYDTNNRIHNVGDAVISYDRDGHVSRVGNAQITYDQDGRIARVSGVVGGGMRLLLGRR